LHAHILTIPYTTFFQNFMKSEFLFSFHSFWNVHIYYVRVEGMKGQFFPPFNRRSVTVRVCWHRSCIFCKTLLTVVLFSLRQLLMQVHQP
jgi:hypothetical protein